jgi:hypothetical protein
MVWLEWSLLELSGAIDIMLDTRGVEAEKEKKS